ncbi:glycosyl transferase group 1 [Methylocella silvestris BL2]|uniref:Glycosyl transferase group 1 n=1 Tax=Methylocella silvestris (strain DSM 15510 / CIP 108128 / LMG 27833 / NCIMB 13906 / BL2) TaxID=395965 RepID=B8EL81_METSB|nr:WcaI family glycosyltransferase [Methylocella silvestris]ACK49076.1 glycosyl transferase group 1 [Methylocella silvestris BL2]
MQISAADTNKRLKILIIGENYAPEMTGVGRFTGEIGAYLAEHGYDVTAVAAPPHYPGWSVKPPFHAGRYARETRDGVAVLRCPILLRADMRGVWRLIAPVSFALTAAPVALWQIVTRRPDVVLCVEPTLAAAPIGLLGKIFGARVLLHVQDLEVDAAFAVGHLQGGALKKAIFSIESWLLRRFDSLVTISGQMRKRLIEKGVAAERIGIVRNWVDLDQIRPLEGSNGFRAELGLSAAFVVLYAGNIGAKQALEVVLDAARALGGAKAIHFVIAGDGPEKARLMRDYGGLPGVHFLPLQPEARLCELLNLADLHVLPQARGAADLVLPSKLGGMLASGKPVLATADAGTELFEVLQGAAILVPAGDSAAMAAEISRLAADGAHPALGDGRRLAQMFARETCLEQFRAWIDPAGVKSAPAGQHKLTHFPEAQP